MFVTAKSCIAWQRQRLNVPIPLFKDFLKRDLFSSIVVLGKPSNRQTFSSALSPCALCYTVAKTPTMQPLSAKENTFIVTFVDSIISSTFGSLCANPDIRIAYNLSTYIIWGQPNTLNQPLQFQGCDTLGLNGQPAALLHAQIYFYDSDKRMKYCEALDRDIDSNITTETNNTLHSVIILIPILHQNYDFPHLHYETNPTAIWNLFLHLELDTPNEQ